MAIALPLLVGTTAEGSSVAVESAAGKLSIGGAALTGADVATKNGVLHAVDALLVPPGIDLANLAAGAN